MLRAQNASVAQLVEHHVANVIVAGSTPVTRSIFFALFRPMPQGRPGAHHSNGDDPDDSQETHELAYSDFGRAV